LLNVNITQNCNMKSAARRGADRPDNHLRSSVLTRSPPAEFPIRDSHTHTQSHMTHTTSRQLVMRPAASASRRHTDRDQKKRMSLSPSPPSVARSRLCAPWHALALPYNSTPTGAAPPGRTSTLKCAHRARPSPHNTIAHQHTAQDRACTSTKPHMSYGAQQSRVLHTQPSCFSVGKQLKKGLS